jgi:serralysin
MKSRFITDPQDPSDGLLNTAGAEVYTNFFPWAGNSGGNPSASIPVEILAPPALTSEAVLSSSAQSGPTSVLAMTSGGITINLLFDAAAMAAPASFRAGIQQAASIMTATISDKITVNIKIDYSGTGGGAAAGPDNGQYVSYSSVRADLINNATPGDTTFNALPSGPSVQGQTNVAVWNAQLKLFGLLGANNTSTDDGSATFATDISPNLLVGVALHELTHAMGRVPYGPQPDIFDLFRFTSVGTRLFADGNTAPASYFSVDAGNTKLADYGRTSDPSDFLNSGVQGFNDPFNEFYSGSTVQALSIVDKEQLDALGFHTMSPVTTTVIEAFGSTSLVQAGNNYYLNSISSGSGPELKYLGAAVAAAQFGAWAPIGVEQTATGYEVAWKNSGSGQYTVWNTDSSGNFVSNGGAMSGTSTTLESLETSFLQDLNGDGVIGVPTVSGPTTTVIESFGSTILVEVGNNSYLNSISSGSGPELKFSGAAVVAGQFSTFTPIGAEQTATGYEVAWKDPVSGQYTVWNTDGSGNFVSNSGVMPGTSATLESLETSFHQDLNGDGVIGVPAPSGTVIESFGSTSLVQAGNNYYLNSISSGSGPELKYTDAAVVAGQFSTWEPIGAEQTATGYEVAWKNSGSGQYTVWNTDSSGGFLSNGGAMSGTSTTLELLETSFHQDLNGDGVIGVPAATSPVGTKTVIETFGSTSLVEVVTNYYLTEFTELKYAGAAVVAGQFSTWAPMGAEQTATGYEVAWKDPGSGQYTVWNTDGSGNFVSNSGAMSGTGATLESLETSFQQDLNGDGVIGVPHAATSPVATNNTASNLADGGPVNVSASTSHDSFVFAPNFGRVTIANDALQGGIDFGHSVFANINALLAAAHDDGHGNATIIDATYDTLTIQHVTQHDFHVI